MLQNLAPAGSRFFHGLLVGQNHQNPNNRVPKIGLNFVARKAHSVLQICVNTVT